MTVSVIIPAYNEEQTVQTTIERVLDLKKENNIIEVIVIDDGSKDKTQKIVTQIQKNHPRVVLIKHRKNKGKGAAVASGIRKAKGEIIVIQDADLEYNPKDIPRLVKPIFKKKSSVVYGNRLDMKPKFFGKNKTPHLKHFFGNKFLSLVTSILYGQSVSDMETGYKAFHKSTLKGIKLRSQSFDFEPEITAKILKKHLTIHEIKIRVKPRGYDEGKKIRTFHDGSIALWTLIKYKFTS